MMEKVPVILPWLSARTGVFVEVLVTAVLVLMVFVNRSVQ